jgi:hypothetical protein
MGEYSALSSGPLLTAYQLLAIWMKFTPVEYPTSYFLVSEDWDGWYMNWELLVSVQMALERLQAVITDVLALVGGKSSKFIIDHDLELSEKLWMARDLRGLRTADKLLKLQVELTFV